MKNISLTKEDEFEKREKQLNNFGKFIKTNITHKYRKPKSNWSCYDDDDDDVAVYADDDVAGGVDVENLPNKEYSLIKNIV